MKNEPNITLRDYFAAKAMQALLTRDNVNNGWSEGNSNQCYYIADEMLKERENGKEESKKTIVSKPKFNKISFRKVLIDLGADKNHIEDWFIARDKKKGVYTQTALNTFLNECEKHNFDIGAAVQHCAEQGWAGFKVQWVKNLQQNNNGQSNNNTEPRINRQTADTIRQNLQDWGT